MTFPGTIKGRANALSLSSSLILAAEQTIFNEESTFNHGPFGDHSFFIYSFFLDQLVLETSS